MRNPLARMQSKTETAYLEDGYFAGRTIEVDVVPGSFRFRPQEGNPAEGEFIYEIILDPTRWPSRDDAGRVHFRLVQND